MYSIQIMEYKNVNFSSSHLISLKETEIPSYIDDEQKENTQNNLPQYVLTNSAFVDFDFYDYSSLSKLSTFIYHYEVIFDDNFNYLDFYDKILEVLLSFDGNLVLFSSKLFLTISYKSSSVTSYLSTKISEIIAVLNEFFRNKYVLLLIQNIILDHPATVQEMLNLNILSILLKSSLKAKSKFLKNIVSIVQTITLNPSLLNESQLNNCLELVKSCLKKNDQAINESLFNIISHLQKCFDIPPESLFDEENFRIMINSLSIHVNTIPILNTISHFHDVEFVHLLLNENFYDIALSIFQDSSLVWVHLLNYFLVQIQASHELIEVFFPFLPIACSFLDKTQLNIKIYIYKFFLICLKYNFHSLIQQNYFEDVFRDIFDMIECSSEHDFIVDFLKLLISLSNNQEIMDFIGYHSDCYQAVYDQQFSNNPKISKHANILISLFQNIKK